MSCYFIMFVSHNAMQLLSFNIQPNYSHARLHGRVHTDLGFETVIAKIHALHCDVDGM